MELDRQAMSVGWRRPYQSPDQRTLFPEPREEVLGRLGITLAQATRWFACGWLSFDISSQAKIDLPELHELIFINMLVRSPLTRTLVEALLKQLPAPYRYDYRRVAYHFAFGWVEPREPEEVPFETQFEDWIEEQVSDGELIPLWNALEQIQLAIKRLQLSGEEE